MLGLKLASDPRWVNIAGKSIGDILDDHAWCEQKAASSGISLIINFPEFTEMVEEVSEMVAEEWGHFERVLAEIRARGFQLGRCRQDEYVLKLTAAEKKGGSRPAQLMEKLLLCAMIEARSCERFKLLYEGLEDAGLRKFYYEFMVSEAGHYSRFLALAKKYQPESTVKKRWDEILAAEANIISSLSIRGDRVH